MCITFIFYFFWILIHYLSWNENTGDYCSAIWIKTKYMYIYIFFCLLPCWEKWLNWLSSVWRFALKLDVWKCWPHRLYCEFDRDTSKIWHISPTVSVMKMKWESRWCFPKISSMPLVLLTLANHWNLLGDFFFLILKFNLQFTRIQYKCLRTWTKSLNCFRLAGDSNV